MDLPQNAGRPFRRRHADRGLPARVSMTALPKIVSLVPRRFEDGGWSGVPRFDFELRAVFPAMRSLRLNPDPRWALRCVRALREPGVVAIVGSEYSPLLPSSVRTVVVHHGCAQTHFDSDPHWRGPGERLVCWAQRFMYRHSNRTYVALARWTAQQFAGHYGVPEPVVIPSWVAPLPRRAARRDRPVVLGDWRTFNKGRDVIPGLRRHLPGVEFRSLSCTYDTRAAAYGDVDAYLCLSLSEGGSYSVCDAEAASLPLITTDVGNYLEYTASRVLSRHDRDDQALVAEAVGQALATPRGPVFFERWTFETWRRAWHDLVCSVAESPPAPALAPLRFAPDVL